MRKQLVLLAFTVLSAMLKSQTLAVPMALESFRTPSGSQNILIKTIVKIDAAKNVYTAGGTITGNGTMDILITKTNSSGVFQWAKQYNGPANQTDFATELIVDASGNVFVTGVTTNDMSANHYTDLILLKLNSSGVQQFVSFYDGSSSNNDAGADVKIDAAGNIYCTGSSVHSTDCDFVTVAYNSSGTQLWASLMQYSAGLNDAGVRMTLGGGIVTVVGVVQTSSTNFKAAVVTYTKTTGAQQSFTVTSSGASGIDQVTCAQTDVNGNIYVGGAKTISGHGLDGWLTKLTPSLTVIFDQTYNGANNLDDVIQGMDVDASGNVFTTGYTSTSANGTDIWSMKCDGTTGSASWVKTFDDISHGNDAGASLKLDASANSYLTGYVKSSSSGLDYYTMKLDNSGNTVWSVQTDGSGLDDQASALALDTNVNVIVAGSSKLGNNTYQYLTVKYVQKNVITPTDFNGEASSANFRYYSNRGQLTAAASSTVSLVPDVKFYTDGTYPSFYFKNKIQSIVFAKIDGIHSTPDTLHRIDLSFTNSISNSETYAMEEQRDSYLNYYTPQSGGAGFAQIYGNNKLITPNLYNNIDLMCSSNQNGIKYYFIVKPGGNLKDIQMQFTGAFSFSLNGSTNALTVNSSVGSLTYKRPKAYQLTSSNATVAVTGWTPDWQTNGASNAYKFNYGSYTSSLTLIIEVDQGNAPAAVNAPINNLTWSTYYGGNGTDVFYDVKCNNSNDVWVGGVSFSGDFPTTTGAQQGTNLGDADAVFVKFTDTGVRKWATYLGGSMDESGANSFGIEVDNTGNSFASLTTESNDFPVKNSHITGAYYDSLPSPNIGLSSPDIAIVSFNTTGQLIWSTFFGQVTPNYSSYSYDIGLDNSNNLIVTGIAKNIPLLHPTGSYTTPFSLTSGCFIAKFDANHNPKWASYIGGDEQYIQKITFSSANDIILVGEVNSDIPLGGVASSTVFDLKNPGGGAYFINTFNGGAYDGIIMRFDGTTNDLNWSTFFGGNNDERLRGVTTDDLNNIYISGESQSTSGMITGNSLGINNTTFAGTGTFFNVVLGDGILAKFNSSNQIVSSTYIGGAANDGSYGINYKNAKLFTNFNTAGDDMPFDASNPANVFVQPHNADGQDVSDDAYLGVFDTNFNFKWSSYFGSNRPSYPAPYKVDFSYSNFPSNSNKFYMVGYTVSDTTNFPRVNPGSGAYFKRTKASNTEAFIARFDLNGLPLSLQNSQNAEQDGLLLYPNPTNTTVLIRCVDNTNYNLEIMDITGRRIYYNEHCTGNNFKVDVSSFSRGAYLVKVTNSEKFIVKKLIID